MKVELKEASRMVSINDLLCGYVKFKHTLDQTWKIGMISYNSPDKKQLTLLESPYTAWSDLKLEIIYLEPGSQITITI